MTTNSSIAARDDDDSKRRRGQVKALILEPIPSASGFRFFQLSNYNNVCATTKQDCIRPLRWIQQVEKATLAELEVPDKRWDDLDVVLSQAVVGIVTGPLHRELMLYQANQVQQGRQMHGLAALWHVY